MTAPRFWRPAALIAVLAALTAAFLAHLRRPPSRPLEALYCGGGEAAAFFEPAMQRAAAPRQLRFSSAGSIGACVPPGGGVPDLVLSLPWGPSVLESGATAKILFTMDPILHPSAGFQLSVHCMRGVPGSAYFPYWAWSFGSRRHHSPGDLIKTRGGVERALQQGKPGFCAFLYSHPSRQRDALFDLLSTYKPVTALGSSKAANPEGSTDRETLSANATFMDLAVQKYAQYKFVIAGENSRSEGCVSMRGNPFPLLL
jgi:hypothetical protein